MIAYCVKSILCLGLLWGFYTLFLEKEKIHFIKRFYLLFSLILALTIPLLTFTYEKEVVMEPPQKVVQNAILFTDIPQIQKPSADALEVTTAEDFHIVLWGIYILGVILFGFRFVNNLWTMTLQIRRNERLREPSHINVLLGQKIIPHSFLNYIFVPKKEFRENGIPIEVLHHEKTHVSQKHTLDILFVEVLQVAFWFNPLFTMLKKAIRLNHEFLADQNVLKQQFSLRSYVELLVNYPNSPNQTELASSINYSLTKKRLQMMTTHFSRKRVMLKLCALIPVVMGCILLFNNEIVAKEIVKAKIHDPAIEGITSEPIEVPENGLIIIKDNFFQDGISKEELKEYRQWIKKIKKQRKSGNGIRLQKEEVDRMETLYKTMSFDQKNKVVKLTDVLPPAPPSPRVGVGEVSNIPPPPPPANPDIDNIPEAPEPPVVAEIDPVKIDMDEEALQEEIEQIRIEEEHIQKEVEKEIEEAMQEAMQEAEEAQMEAMASMESAEVQRALAMKQTQISREQAERIRKQAMEQARAARAVAFEAAQVTRNEVRVQAMNAAREAHEMKKKEYEIRRTALVAAHQARKNAEKARIIVMKEAKKAHIKRREHSSYALIKQMADHDAEFYYNGKQIDAEKALEIVRNSGDNLSINAKTKNGRSKIKIRD